MKTNLKRKNNFFFSGLAILALLFGAYWSVQNGLLNGSPSTVFAQVVDGDSGFLDDGTIIPDGSGPLQTAPAPARNDQCSEVGAPVDTCHTDGGTGHRYCQWTETGNIVGDCSVETCFNGGTPPSCNGATQEATQTWACMNNQSLCGANQTYCEPTGAGAYHLVTKHSGVCDPANGAHESDGCAYVYDVDPTNYRDANCTTTSQPQPQPAANLGTCYICDGGNWRVAGGSGHQMTSDQCNQEQNSAFNQPNKPSWCGAKEEAREVPATPAPTAAPAPAQAIQQQGQVVYAFGGNSTSLAYSYSGGSNVTINQAAPEVAPRVVTVAAPAVTKVAASKVAVEELPKTGLPLAAWTLSGFLPVGLGLRRFGSAKKSLQGSASYLWQKREFSK